MINPNSPWATLLDTRNVRLFYHPVTQTQAYRQYQSKACLACVEHNTLVVLPTGLGKTLIAASLLYNFQRWFPTGIAIFCAPTKPLVTQQCEAVRKTLRMEKSACRVVTGDERIADRCAAYQEGSGCRALFGTPQSLLHDVRSGMLEPRRVCLFVIDEAHRATGEYAYVHLRDALVRGRPMPGKTTDGTLVHPMRTVGLSATPGATAEKVREVLKNLALRRVFCRRYSDKDVAPYVFDKNERVVVVDPRGGVGGAPPGGAGGQEGESEGVDVDMDDLDGESQVLHHLKQCLSVIAASLMTYGCSSTTEADRITQFVVGSWRTEFLAGRMTTCHERVMRNENAKQEVLSLYACAGALCDCIAAVKRAGAVAAICKLNDMTPTRKTQLSANRWGNHFLNAARAWRQCIADAAIAKASEDALDARLRANEGGPSNAAGIGAPSMHGAPKPTPKLLELCKMVRAHLERRARRLARGGDAAAADDDEYSDEADDDNLGGILVFANSRGMVERTVMTLTAQVPGVRVSRFVGQGTSFSLAGGAGRGGGRGGRGPRGGRGAAGQKGQNRQQQKAVIAQFAKSELDVLVCTCIGEEGLDLPAADVVVHLDVTTDPRRRIQRSGRTGRHKANCAVVHLLERGKEVEDYRAGVAKQAQIEALLKAASDDVGCPAALSIGLKRGEEGPSVFPTMAMLGVSSSNGGPSYIKPRLCRTDSPEAEESVRAHFIGDIRRRSSGATGAGAGAGGRAARAKKGKAPAPKRVDKGKAPEKEQQQTDKVVNLCSPSPPPHRPVVAADRTRRTAEWVMRELSSSSDDEDARGGGGGGGGGYDDDDDDMPLPPPASPSCEIAAVDAKEPEWVPPMPQTAVSADFVSLTKSGDAWHATILPPPEGRDLDALAAKAADAGLLPVVAAESVPSPKGADLDPLAAAKAADAGLLPVVAAESVPSPKGADLDPLAAAKAADAWIGKEDVAAPDTPPTPADDDSSPLVVVRPRQSSLPPPPSPPPARAFKRLRRAGAGGGEQATAARRGKAAGGGGRAAKGTRRHRRHMFIDDEAENEDDDDDDDDDNDDEEDDNDDGFFVDSLSQPPSAPYRPLMPSQGDEGLDRMMRRRAGVADALPDTPPYQARGGRRSSAGTTTATTPGSLRDFVVDDDDEDEDDDDDEDGDVACRVCGSAGDAENMLLCDGCTSGAYHLYCLHPRLDAIPQGDWFCPICARGTTRAQAAPSDDDEEEEQFEWGAPSDSDGALDSADGPREAAYDL